MREVCWGGGGGVLKVGHFEFQLGHKIGVTRRRLGVNLGSGYLVDE